MAERDSTDAAREERQSFAELDATAPPDLDIAGKLTPARSRSDVQPAERLKSEESAAAPEADTAPNPEPEAPPETELPQPEDPPALEPRLEPREPRLSPNQPTVRLDGLPNSAPPLQRRGPSRDTAQAPRRPAAASPHPPLRSDRAIGGDWPPGAADPERRRRAVMWRMSALAAAIFIAGAATIAFQLGSLYEPPQRVAVSGLSPLAALPGAPAESEASARRVSVVNKMPESPNGQVADSAPPAAAGLAPQGGADTVPLPTGGAELPPPVRPGERVAQPADEPAQPTNEPTRSAEAAAEPSEETGGAVDEIAAMIEESAPAAVEPAGSADDVRAASDETAAFGEAPQTIAAASDSAASTAGSGPAQVTTDVNMRSGPANEAEPITVIPQGSEVTVLGCDYWCEVSFAGRRGYVYRDFVQPRGA